MLQAALMHLILNPEIIAGLAMLGWLIFTQVQKNRHLGNAAEQAKDAQLQANVQRIVHAVADTVHGAFKSGLIPVGLNPLDVGLQALEKALDKQGLTLTEELEHLFTLVYGQFAGDVSHVLGGAVVALPSAVAPAPTLASGQVVDAQPGSAQGPQALAK